MDMGDCLLGVWGWLGVAAENAAGAAETTLGAAPEFPFWQHLARVGAVLTGMLGVLVLVLYLWKRFGSGVLRAQGASPLIRILATHYLAPKKALIMVAVGRERLLLASTGEQLQLLASLAPDADAPPELKEEPGSPIMPTLGNEKQGRG
jgi:flagellar biogenesis protein FliO